jgi:hypothetical protein
MAIDAIAAWRSAKKLCDGANPRVARRLLKARRVRVRLLSLVSLPLLVGSSAALAWQPLPVQDDPLLRMPGSQPGDDITLQSSTNCVGGCHGDFDPEVEPGFSWGGSMMAQATRDPLFWAALAVAAQDSIWALGRPNATDLCLRCHTPRGWLGGRSDPTNGSKLVGDDFGGVSCDFCHRLVDPFFEQSFSGARESSDWSGYWDESNLSSTPSTQAAAATRMADRLEVEKLRMFNGSPLYDGNHEPMRSGWSESTSGQFVVSAESDRRGPFADADSGGQHGIDYSRFHKSRYFCGTCHDVSNPALANLDHDGATPGDGATVLPTEDAAAHSYAHVERTFSEMMLSDFGRGAGALGSGSFAASQFATSRPDGRIATCQDCHLADGIGPAALGDDAVLRPDDSREHPRSGQPVHELSGGNAWIPWLLASAVPGSPNFDVENEALLTQGPALLTLDLSQGTPLNPDALLAASDRAVRMLQSAADIDTATFDPSSGQLRFRIINHTGHKLITGYPEGRRMFVNVRAFDDGALVYEINPYDEQAATLRGLAPDLALSSPPLGASEQHIDELVYEMRSRSSLTGEEHSLHFVLSTERVKDNRIPPRGFRISDAAERISQPVYGGTPAPDYFDADEYLGGYDAVEIDIPVAADAVRIRLLYQTTSREYIEFLRDEIDGTATTLASPTPSGEAQAYIAQTDPFFSGLAAWGQTIWKLWDHNRDVPGAAPVLMAEAVLGNDEPCATKIAGEACDDFDLCTTDDRCGAGICAGTPIECSSANDCRSGSCNALTGQCEEQRKPDGASCAEGSCEAGVCLPPEAVDEGCGCRVVSTRQTLPAPWWLIPPLLVWRRLRRRRVARHGCGE